MDQFIFNIKVFQHAVDAYIQRRRRGAAVRLQRECLAVLCASLFFRLTLWLAHQHSSDLQIPLRLDMEFMVNILRYRFECVPGSTERKGWLEEPPSARGAGSALGEGPNRPGPLQLALISALYTILGFVCAVSCS